MKKMIFALVAMFVMTMSANAQSNDSSVMFKRVSCYLDLTEGQMDQMKASMVQLAASFENPRQLHNVWAVNKSLDRHKRQMKLVLSEKQYKKYEEILNLTIANTFKINMANAFKHNLADLRASL